jgi:hypothetical protein
MHPSKLRAMVAILATVAGFSAFAVTAEAQISGSTGGNVVVKHPAPVLGDPILWLTDGNAVIRRSW